VSKIAELLAAHAIRAEADWHLPPHLHSFCELIVVHRGRLRVRLNNTEHVAGPGGLLLYPAGVAHEEWAEGGTPLATTCLVFTWHAMKEQPLLRHDRSGRVEMMALWLADEQDGLYPDSHTYREALFGSLLADFVRIANHQPHAMVEKVRRYIRQHMEEELTLDTLAEEAAMSKFHFARQYKVLTGRSPMEDVRLLRIEEARRLILSTSMTLCEIAPRIGLANGHHLSRLLKAHFGTGIRALRHPISTP